jgi:glycosyltransferase involved in cell wall biosynthesis
MHNVKISIIVPIYNAEKFLYKCLDSIVNQSYKNLEIILINDGSRDNSLSICQKFAARDDRIILIDKKNEGVSPTRNVGLSVTSGDYIGFVDSDDYISCDMYENLLYSIELSNADIIECGYYWMSEDYVLIKKVEFKGEELVGNYNCSYKFIKKENTRNFNCNKLYKREIFDDIRFGDIKYGKDYFVNVQAFYKCNKKVTIGECFYYYVRNKNSITTSGSIDEKLDVIRTGEKAINFYRDNLPSLSKYAVLDILFVIRGLYDKMMESDNVNKRKYEKILAKEFKKYYSMIKKKLYGLTKYKRTYVAMILFLISPRVYYYIAILRKNILLKKLY